MRKNVRARVVLDRTPYNVGDLDEEIMSVSLGKLITPDHVSAAFDLLQVQLNSDAHTHRCIGLEILRRENGLSGADAASFHADYLATDAFFNYPDYFRAIPYSVPKGDGGLRSFHFLEAPLRILYYSLGFCFLELTEPTTRELRPIRRRAGINTYYGANIRRDDPARSQIYYQTNYQQFTRQIRRAVRQGVHDGYQVSLIHLDIQDFFGSINHARLVDVIDSQTLSTQRFALRFNEEAKQSVRDFLYFIMGGSQGLPLSQQNIVSNLIADLYLHPIDCYIHRKLQMEDQYELSFHRYVDDMFIVVRLDQNVRKAVVGEQMLDISTRVGSQLANQLAGLTLNPLKTRFAIVDDEAGVDDLIEKSKLVSFAQPLPEGKDEEEPPQVALCRAIAVLQQLKRVFNETGCVTQDAWRVNDDLALKQCFHRAVVEYTNSAEARTALEDAFEDFSPALMPKSIKALVFLISRAPRALHNLFEHVREALGSGDPSLTHLHLTDRLMLLPEYRGELDQVVTQLQNGSDSYASLIRRLVEPSNPSRRTHIRVQRQLLLERPGLAQQVRHTVLAERRGTYNVAFNHLLNILHEWCFTHDDTGDDRHGYNRNNVIRWLEGRAPHDELVFVMELFDRRNQNAISHPGEEGVEVRPVDHAEYQQWRDRLNRFLEQLECAVAADVADEHSDA